MQGRPSRVVVAILRQLPKVDVAVLQFMMVDHRHSDYLYCDYQEGTELHQHCAHVHTSGTCA